MFSLWLVRHGETDWNTETRVQGWTDVPLNAAGEYQAHQLGRQLEGIPFRYVVASDLARAQRTAQILTAYVGGAVRLDKRLRERGFGAAEGMIRRKSEALYPNDAPDAEPIPQLDARATAFLRSLTDLPRPGRVLCVTHGGLIRAMMRAQFQRHVLSPDNTSVTRLSWDGQRWLLQAFGVANHLRSSTQP